MQNGLLKIAAKQYLGHLGMPSKKKSPYGGKLSQPHFNPFPPSKSREQNSRELFLVLDPPPPLEN